MAQNEEIILIDGNRLINRAFYAVPPLTTKAGEPAGAVYGFTNMLIKLIESHSPGYIAVAFDMKAKTFILCIFHLYIFGIDINNPFRFTLFLLKEN